MQTVFILLVFFFALAQSNPVKRARPAAFFPGNNVALRKTVTASSAVEGVDPQALVDGNPDSNFKRGNNKCTLTMKEENPYLVIDMGESYHIYAVDLWTRKKTTEAIAEKDSNLEIRIGNDEDFTKNPVCKYLPGRVDQHVRFLCDEVLCGRYMSIQRVRPGFIDNLNICELRGITEDKTITCNAPVGATRDDCFLAREQGTCGNNLARWYFNEAKCRCQPFAYGGCDGNANNFETLEDCQSLCEEWTQPAECLEPTEAGDCGDNQQTRYYFNSETNLCKKFIYTGCGGNGNNFASKTDCRNKCKRC